MKKHLSIFIFICLAFVALEAHGQNWPHNMTNGIGCDSCHFVFGTEPALLPPWTAHEPQNIDDTQFNVLCWSCHNDIIAPFVNTHSSLQTDNSYGDWSIECRNCHNAHGHEQIRSHGSESYRYEGISTNITVTTITQAGAGWAVDQWKGLPVFPNVLDLSYSYKILSNTADTLTVQGPIVLGAVTAGDTFAIVYSKLIRSNLLTPNSGVKAVKFFDFMGPNSFADGDMVYDGICEVCHTMTTHHRNDGSGPAQSHNDGTDCVSCHFHLDGFAASGDCVECHTGVPDGATYVTRDVVGSDFTRASRHVFGGTVTNWDCIVCHREGDENAAAGGDVGLTALHNNGGTPVVDMRNVDTPADGWVWDKNNTSDGMFSDMDSFCLGCHDADGASGINVNSNDDGVNLSNARALTPFNSTDDVSQGVGGGTVNMPGYERTAVLDVAVQFDPTNPSHHAVIDQAYQSHNANWGDEAWVNTTLKSGDNLMTVYEAARLHCADCHTVDSADGGAHGGANGFMLQASSIDDTCFICHNSNVYFDPDRDFRGISRWDHDQEGAVWDPNDWALLGQYGANEGSACLNCHGGDPAVDGFGGIHGLQAGLDWRSNEPRYRFQGGSYMSHQPSSWTGTSGATPTCYFSPTSDTQDWSKCTQHGGPGDETEDSRTSPPNYSRGVPGDY